VGSLSKIGMQYLTPIHEMFDTHDLSLFLSPARKLPAPLLSICINFKVKWYDRQCAPSNVLEKERMGKVFPLN
jgi:hypothetical protein